MWGWFNMVDMIDFDYYWLNFGKFHTEVVDNPRELEEDFRKLCEKVWKDITRYEGDAYEKGHSEGWDACKEHYRLDVNNKK